MRRLLWTLVAVLSLLVLVTAGMVAREFIDSSISLAKRKFNPDVAQIERGEYLAKLGNCAGCHSARDGKPYAGGKPIDTPFGTIYASNLTPDVATGIGAWGTSSFESAMRYGISYDGRFLYPAFPYPNMTRITREDSDALFAYLSKSVKPVSRVNTPNTLSFPFNTQIALAAWRVLYFKPEPYQADSTQSAQWNRGAYLVQGLAHCGACHSTRNALGAPVARHIYDGAMMPGNDWYAPSLTDKREASVADWPIEQIAQWLKDGTSKSGAALGPMAEIVFQSTQYASNADLAAMSEYLKSLPTSTAKSTGNAMPTGTVNEAGKRLYRDRCATCHGDNGEGKSDAFPALVGNRTVTMANATNLVTLILKGGFAPATVGNPRPHGMPPFYHLLTDTDIADVATYIRNSWGNAAPALTELDMVKYRNALGAGR